jgi:serine/threonine protein kinase
MSAFATEIGASFVVQMNNSDTDADSSTIISSVMKGGLADRAGWKEGFKLVNINGDIPVESSTQLTSVLNGLLEKGAVECQLHADPRPDEPEPVVLKLMQNKEQYNREIEQRNGLDKTMCVPVIFHSDEAPELWEKGVTQRGYSEYKYGIVMPAAERNLLVVLVQERVTFTGIRSMLHSVAQGLQHMHSMGKVHGDLKPLNVVRSYKGDFQLIDFDATVELGKPIGAKTSTAYVPPELIVEGSTVGYPVVQSHGNIRARASMDKWMAKVLPRRTRSSSASGGHSIKALAAHETFDIWSFAVVAYRALAREVLFKCDDSDNAPLAELDRIFRWDHSKLDQSVRKLHNFLLSGGLLMGGDTLRSHTLPTPRDALMTAELLAWMLQPDPSCRPQSFDEVLNHPFFAAAAAHDSTGDQDSIQRSMSSYVEESDNDGLELSWKMSPLHVASALGILESALNAGRSKKPVDNGKVVAVPLPMGMSFNPEGSGFIISNVKEGGNAKATGKISKGMKMVSVNGKSLAGMDKQEVVTAIKASNKVCTIEFAPAAEQMRSEMHIHANFLSQHANTPEPLMDRTPLHLAVGGGHVQVVEMLLLDPTLAVDVNRKDKMGYTALHGLLVMLGESATSPTDNQLQIVRLLFGRCDLELVDDAGRSAMRLGSLSQWKKIRAVFSRRVITQVQRRELFNATDFMAVER